MGKKLSRKGTLRRCGHIWNAANMGYPDDWETTVDGRFHILTWKFGSIHQAKVLVDYEHKMNGKVTNSIKHDGTTDFYLEYGKTLTEAMQICLDWIADFQKKGPPSVEQMFKDKWEQWPDLYPQGMRLPVIDHIFFVIGGGYSWFDGGLVSTSPYAHIESNRRKERDKDLEKALEAAKEIRKMVKERKLAKGEELDFDDLDWDEQRAIFWKQDVYRFYPASEGYSNICLVPDDVKPEWLALAYEAAILLRDKSGVPKIKSRRYNGNEDDEQRQEENRKLGAKVVKDLEKRFPQLKGQNAKESK